MIHKGLICLFLFGKTWLADFGKKIIVEKDKIYIYIIFFLEGQEAITAGIENLS